MDFTEVASTVRKRRMGGGGCGTVSCLSSVCRAEAFTELAAFSTRDARCTLARVGTEAESCAGEMHGLASGKTASAATPVVAIATPPAHRARRKCTERIVVVRSFERARASRSDAPASNAARRGRAPSCRRPSTLAAAARNHQARTQQPRHHSATAPQAQTRANSRRR